MKEKAIVEMPPNTACTGLLSQVFLHLFEHLLEHGGLDPRQELASGSILIIPAGAHCQFIASPHLQGTWQLSTALLFLQLAYTRGRKIREVRI